MMRSPINEYGKDLENWDGELARFRSFTSFVDKWLQSIEGTESTKAMSSETAGTETTEDKTKIETEASDLFFEYPTESMDSPSHFKVFISKSLTEHYIIEIDFRDYPEKPLIKFPPKLEKMLGPPGDALLTIGNWNPKNPPKIVFFHGYIFANQWSYGHHQGS
ncbi:MAG: hypothetical protein ACTSSI_18430 [Candidatus Helarchaeota archaeon]